MSDDLPTLYAYHRWADERVIDACRKLSPAQYAEVEPFEVGWPSIRSIVVHLAWATDLWSRRFLGEASIPMFAEADLPTLDEAAARLFSAHDRINGEVLPSLTPERIAGVFTYRNIKGVEYSVPFWSVLRHVVNHGTYHRGQLASKFKRRGVDPPVTDLVYWAIETTPQP
jgi:uncharacterized damage-inducible protein DinB